MGLNGSEEGSTDQNRKIFKTLGPVRTRTEKILEIPDQLGPGPRQSLKSRTNSDQDRIDYLKLQIGPNRTRTVKKNQILGPDQDPENFEI